jgi:2-dehydropantoate 2-reductase
MPSGWRIAVIGAGAIGGNLGGWLALAGEDVTLIDAWPEHVAAIRAGGLRIGGVRGDHQVTVPAYHPGEVSGLCRGDPPFDLLIVAVKSYDTDWATALMAPALRPGGFAVSAQNGLNEERIAARLGFGRVVGCVVLLAGALWEPGHVIRTEGPNDLVVGELHGRATPRLAHLAEALAPVANVQTTSNIWGELWAKLVQNSMSNPVAGVTGLLIREVREQPEARRVSIAAAAEGARVGLALGYAIEPILGVAAEDFIAAAEGRAPEVGERLAAQGPAVGNIRGSLPRDIIKGLRTEVDAFNGEICRRGAELGIATPINAAILRLVRAVERGERTPGPENLRELLAELA